MELNDITFMSNTIISTGYLSFIIQEKDIVINRLTAKNNKGKYLVFI